MDPLVCVTIASPEPLPAQVLTLFSLLTDLGKVCFLTFRLLLVIEWFLWSLNLLLWYLNRKL